MQVDFVRFKATDGVELQGWFTNASGDTAVIHMHGMSGNGYENHFLDNLRKFYNDNGIAFFSIDSRGRGIISDFRHGDEWKHAGSCFELFEESLYDIEGAIRFLQALNLNKKHIILEGHSLGCTKIVNYWLQKAAHELKAIILIAPTDMVGWAKTDPKHGEYLNKAKQLIADNKGEELVGAQCWIDKTPISAQTYVTICEAGSSADIYGERENRALLGRVSAPMLIIYGTSDIGITEIDGSIEAWEERANKIKHPHTRIKIVDGASHGFRGYEKALTNEVQGFIQEIEN